MKKIWIGIFIIAAVALAIVLVVTQTKKELGEIKIGVIAPLTGELAEPGTKSFNGIKLAVDQYNKTNPKMPIKLIVEDSRALPTDGVNAINKLIHVDHIKLVIGDLTSGVTLAIAPIAEKNHVVVIAPGASNPKVRNAGDYIFRNWASDNFDGEVMAKYLIKKLGKKRAVVFYINNEYGTGLADAFEKTFVENGGMIILKEKYDQGASDFRTILTKMKGTNFDCVYLPGQPRENGLLIRQLREIGIVTTVAANLSVESPDFYKIAKEEGEGIIFSTPAFDVNSNEQNIKTFIEAYERMFKSKPDVVAGHGYDAANILIQAIKMANYDINEVKNELYKIKDFPGVTGNTTFDDHGDVVKQVMIKKLNKDGSAIIIDVYKP
jgi:branched-chain amino acid transport system substrate-binding protein